MEKLEKDPIEKTRLVEVVSSLKHYSSDSEASKELQDRYYAVYSRLQGFGELYIPNDVWNVVWSDIKDFPVKQGESLIVLGVTMATYLLTVHNTLKRTK